MTCLWKMKSLRDDHYWFDVWEWMYHRRDGIIHHSRMEATSLIFHLVHGSSINVVSIIVVLSTIIKRIYWVWPFLLDNGHIHNYYMFCLMASKRPTEFDTCHVFWCHGVDHEVKLKSLSWMYHWLCMKWANCVETACNGYPFVAMDIH